MEFCPEISFSILFLSNILLHKPIKPQKFKTKIKASLNSGQLHFPRQKTYESFNMVCVVSIITYKWLCPTRNTENMYPSSHFYSKLLQKCHLIWHLLKGKSMEANRHQVITIDKLKDWLSLAGKFNQSINQVCRNLVKPSLPVKFTKLGEKAEKSCTCFFGDSISESGKVFEREQIVVFIEG